MTKNFAQIAFTESVKAEQEKYGSRRQYARMEALARGTELSFAEADFIRARDSFYLATVGENGYPYVQFRGGAVGFLQVLDAHTLGFADFRGNVQYISTGNLRQNDRAAVILMDYPARQRLKMFVRVEIKDAADAPDLIAQLAVPTYTATIERAYVLHIEAFDWNCQQHITPRYTIDEIRVMNQPLHEQIARLETLVRQLQMGNADAR